MLKENGARPRGKKFIGFVEFIGFVGLNNVARFTAHSSREKIEYYHQTESTGFLGLFAFFVDLLIVFRSIYLRYQLLPRWPSKPRALPMHQRQSGYVCDSGKFADLENEGYCRNEK
jgi:hypothetical protein